MSKVLSVVSPVLSAIGVFKGPGKPPAAIRPPTRDDAAAETARDDELRRRRGSAADQLLGPSSGEAKGVSVKTLTGE